MLFNDPFYLTLYAQQQIVPNVTHGHLQGDNTKRMEVENKGRESIAGDGGEMLMRKRRTLS